MSTELKATFTITSWDDRPERSVGDGPLLTRTKATQAYQGAISGQGIVEYLMCAGADGWSHFVGFESITGTVDGRVGSFIIEHVGVYSGEPRSQWTVVPGSGTGALEGIAGKGSYAASNGIMEVQFDYELLERV